MYFAEFSNLNVFKVKDSDSYSNVKLLILKIDNAYLIDYKHFNVK